MTNDCTAAEFIQSLPGDGRFMQSAIHRFGPGDVMALFERLGVPLKVERGRRVFPGVRPCGGCRLGAGALYEAQRR